MSMVYKDGRRYVPVQEDDFYEEALRTCAAIKAGRRVLPADFPTHYRRWLEQLPQDIWPQVLRDDADIDRGLRSAALETARLVATEILHREYQEPMHLHILRGSGKYSLR